MSFRFRVDDGGFVAKDKIFPEAPGCENVTGGVAVVGGRCSARVEFDGALILSSAPTLRLASFPLSIMLEVAGFSGAG